MSKLANRPIECNGVNVEVKNNMIVCSFNNNEMSVILHDGFKFERLNDQQVKIENLKPESRTHKALFGTTIALVKNAISGLKTPFQKIVNLEGVGYKGIITNDIITLHVGFSHVINLKIPSNVVVKMETLKKISITSKDKWACGEFAAILARQKRFNRYNGAGIVIDGKTYIRKEVKKK